MTNGGGWRGARSAGLGVGTGGAFRGWPGWRRSRMARGDPWNKPSINLYGDASGKCDGGGDGIGHGSFNAAEAQPRRHGPRMARLPGIKLRVSKIPSVSALGLERRSLLARWRRGRRELAWLTKAAASRRSPKVGARGRGGKKRAAGRTEGKGSARGADRTPQRWRPYLGRVGSGLELGGRRA